MTFRGANVAFGPMRTSATKKSITNVRPINTSVNEAMPFQSLTFRSIRATPVVLKLKRPVVARIATITDWPLILIDLYTEEGMVGRSYLEPYTTKTMKYLVPSLRDLGELFKGRKLVPLELYELARKSLHFVGYQGQSMIAVSGLDMAAWLEWQDWAYPVLQKPYEIKNGLLYLPNVPGLGLEWNEEIISANRINL